MENQKKEIGKALTTDEIRAQAHNWTLAGDVGLLAHLEEFSKVILHKTQETQCSMTDLINSYEETSTVVNNVTNQFLAIQNSQFVENRVYDDETPSEEKTLKTEEVDKEAEEQLMLSRYKEAVEKGIKLLNTHFEEFQLPPSSDSDEEDFSPGNGALIWKPKNPYSGKQFPLLIGSAEWWADDNVGLGEYEENVDSEKVLSESDSDMEADRNIEKRVRMSSSSSLESDSGMNKKIKIPESSSTYDDIFNPGDDKFSTDIFLKKGDDLFGEPDNIFGETKEIPKVSNYLGDNVGVTNTFHEKVLNDPLFDNDDDELGKKSEEIQPVTVKQKKVENAFTKELAAKLGSVANKQSESPKPGKPEVPFERKPEKKQEDAFLVDDEDNNDDLFSSKPISTTSAVKKPNLFSDLDNDDQLFGGSDNLFRDDSSKSFHKNDFSSSVKSSSNNSSQGNHSATNNSKSAVPKNKSLFDGDLFANIDDDDDTLFSSTSKISHPQNSRISVDENDNSPKVKFSTPFETKNSALDTSDDLFGTISAVDVYDGSSTNVSDGSLNAARLLEDDSAQDLGFSEHSQHEISRSKSLRVAAEESPDLFRPQLSSTRRISHETSDYRTQKILSDQDTDSSNMPHSQDGSKDKMGHNEKSHFSRAESDVNKGKGFFADDEDDLFSSNISKPIPSSLFDESSNKKSKDSNIFSGKKQDTLFEDDDNSLFADAPKQSDSVSVSSSRSSLFDEASTGKSTLASVFDSSKNSKTSDDLFKTGNEDLFSGDKTNDLFSSVGSQSKSKESKSLFGDVGDADDLFSGKTSKNLFADDGAEDLFGGASKAKEKPEKPDVATKPEVAARSEVKTAAKPEVAAKPEFKPEVQIVPNKIKESKIETVDDIFGDETFKIEKSEELKPESENKKDDLFGEISTNKEKSDPGSKTDDLFNKISKKEEKSVKIENKIDDLFNKIPQKEEIPDQLISKNVTDDIFREVSKKEEKSDKLESEISSDDIFSTGITKKTDLNTKLFFDDDNTDDLFSSSSKNVKESSDENKKTKSLFNDLEEDDNLFSAKPIKPPVFHEKKEKPNVKEDPLGLLDNQEAKIIKPGKAEKPSPPKSLNIKKYLESENATETAVKPKKIGKLNIPTSLNINPTALLPGANLPKKSKDPDANLDSPVEAPSNLLKCTNKDRVKIRAQRRPQSRRARQEALRSSGIDFGSEPTDPEKPSVSSPPKTAETTNTKKSSDPPENVDSSGSIFHSVENSPDTLFSSPLPSNPLSPSTDEEDYFNVPELDVNFEKEDQSIFKSNLKNNVKKPDDNLLFDGAPVLSPLSPKKDVLGSSKPEKAEKPPKSDLLFDSFTGGSKIKKHKIFDDDDEVCSEEDNLFKNEDSNSLSSDKSKKNPVKPDETLFSEPKPFKLSANNEVLKKNLFDEDDNDDLFGGKPVSQIPSSTVPKEISIAKSTVKKSSTEKSSTVDKSKECFIDPLGLMSNPD